MTDKEKEGIALMLLSILALVSVVALQGTASVLFVVLITIYFLFGVSRFLGK